jgi:hypothetical protein
MSIIRGEIKAEMADIAGSVCVVYHISCGGHGLFKKSIFA